MTKICPHCKSNNIKTHNFIGESSITLCMDCGRRIGAKTVVETK